MDTRRFWVIVASRDHIARGIREGFVQANHGKAGPLRRMRPGDGVLCYSPRTVYGGGEALQGFTAIGSVDDAPVVQGDMGGGFTPWRRSVTFVPATEAPIAPLIGTLDFIPDPKRWGYRFRFGFFEIGGADFARIAAAMGVDAGAAGGPVTGGAEPRAA